MPRTAAFHAGISAFECGANPSMNPYKPESRQAAQWLCGWRYARDEFIYDDVVSNEGSLYESEFESLDLERLARGISE